MVYLLCIHFHSVPALNLNLDYIWIIDCPLGQDISAQTNWNYEGSYFVSYYSALSLYYRIFALASLKALFVRLYSFTLLNSLFSNQDNFRIHVDSVPLVPFANSCLFYLSQVLFYFCCRLIHLKNHSNFLQILLKQMNFK